MKQFLFLLCLIVSTTIAHSQSKGDTLTNKTILQLHGAGLGVSVIQSKIESSICSFDLSTDALVALKKARVPDEVIPAMLSKSSPVSQATGAGDTSQAAPGIYYCKGSPCALTEIEASVYSQAKMGSGFLTALTYGAAKTNMKATLAGPSANLEIGERSPSFYFYFDKSASSEFGKSGAQAFWFSAATSPNEFILVKFSVSKKTREVVTGSWNTYAGMSSGIDDKNKVSFKYEKVSPGVYRVFFKEPLEKGQYCFMYAGASTYGAGGTPLQKVYDFGIH